MRRETSGGGFLWAAGIGCFCAAGLLLAAHDARSLRFAAEPERRAEAEGQRARRTTEQKLENVRGLLKDLEGDPADARRKSERPFLLSEDAAGGEPAVARP